MLDVPGYRWNDLKLAYYLSPAVAINEPDIHMQAHIRKIVSFGQHPLNLDYDDVAKHRPEPELDGEGFFVTGICMN